MPRQLPTTLRPRTSRSSPRRKPPPSRSQSAAAVPDINAPSRTVRPPFRLFDPFSAGLHRFQPNGFQGSRSYLRRHVVQFRGALILSHIWTDNASGCADFLESCTIQHVPGAHLNFTTHCLSGLSLHCGRFPLSDLSTHRAI